MKQRAVNTHNRRPAPFPVLPSGRDRTGIFSAKLLFEFFITAKGKAGVRRLCEERIVLIQAVTATQALREANRQGRAGQYRSANGGNLLHFRFVGVMDLVKLGIECEDNEVWYDIRVRERPMERKKCLVPPPQTLTAMREERQLPLLLFTFRGGALFALGMAAVRFTYGGQ